MVCTNFYQMMNTNLIVICRRAMSLFVFLFCLILVSSDLSAQSEKSLLRTGNEHYNNKEFGEAEINYRKSINKNDKGNLEIAAFNLGDALYQQERYAEAADQFAQATVELQTRADKAKAFHNLGNAYLKALLSGQEKKGEQFLEKSIEAFKNALRHNPMDEASKHNLAYVKNLKKQQQGQQQQNQEQQNQDESDQKQENKENQEQQEQQNQEQQQKEEKKENEEQQQEEQQKQGDKGDKEDEQKKAQQKSQGDQEEQLPNQEQLQEQESRQLTKEEAARLLQALKNEELKVQQKLQKQKGKGQKIRIEKDW